MATTTNYGWTTPDDTALVKDGAAAIRTLGTSIDTTTKNLNPSTTLGDIEYRSSTANTNTRLGIGTTGQILTVAGGVPSWATAAAPSVGDSWTLLNSGGTALTGAATVTVSGISGKEKLFILVSGASSSVQSTISLRFNTDTGNNYYAYGGFLFVPSAYATSIGQSVNGADNQLIIGQMSNNTSSTVSGYCLITGCSSSTNIKFFTSAGGSEASGGNNHRNFATGGYYNSTTAITSVSVSCPGGGSLDAGTVFVYANS